jgi:hypothetical protein
METYNVVVSIPLVSGGTVAAGTSRHALFALPGTAQGGGITLTKVKYSSNAAIAAGSAPALNLITMTTTGAAIATIGANGSAALTAGTPIAGTISTYYVSGTTGYLGLEVGQGAFGAATTITLHAHIQYVMGRGDE